jgi:uncharacterized protein YjbI with pentapeptide repeats
VRISCETFARNRDIIPRISRCRFAGADLSAANLFKMVFDVANLNGANLIDAHFPECAQLTAARNWQSAFRDETLNGPFF